MQTVQKAASELVQHWLFTEISLQNTIRMKTPIQMIRMDQSTGQKMG